MILKFWKRGKNVRPHFEVKLAEGIDLENGIERLITLSEKMENVLILPS